MTIRRVDKIVVPVQIDDFKFGMVQTSAIDKRKVPSEGAEVIHDFYVEALNLVKRKGYEKANSTDLDAIPHSLTYYKEEI